MRRAFFTLLIAVSLARVSGARGNEPQIASLDVPQLIAALADPDSAVRKQAGERLVDIGLPARPQIVKASRSDNPEQRAQAAQILRKLPWYTPDDPDDVRAQLERYGESNDSGRSAIIRRLDDMNAAATLLRLMSEEPSDAVRWQIVASLFYDRDPAAQKALRDLDPADSDAPALMLAGAAWNDRDYSKSLAFFRRAIDADAAHPCNDFGILTLAFDQLISAALEAQDFQQAADLLRRQVPRELLPRRVNRRVRQLPAAALAHLLALHEYFGPLRGCEWDCQTWSVNRPPPTLLANACTMLANLGSPPPLPSGLTANLAPEDRYVAGLFLVNSQLPTAAEIELLRGLAQTKSSNREMMDSAFLFLLARIAGDRDEDTVAADRLERALSLRGRVNPDQTRADDLWSELHWRRARAAQAAGDGKRADREVEQLMQFNPSNTDGVIKIVQWLKQTSRDKQAKSLFDRAYEQDAAQLNSAVSKASAHNNLAWLSARCGERLDEAVKLAQAAVDEMPDVPAFLDTLAEAKYRTGHRDDAIRLETKAAQLSPQTKFMQEQLDRFKANKP